MTMPGGTPEPAAGFFTGFGARIALARADIRGGLRTLLRSPRNRPGTFVPAWRRYAAASALVAALAGASMVLLDAPAYAFASGLPVWVVDTFFDVTDLGLSGWILVPAGLIVAILIAVDSPSLSHAGRAVLAMMAVRVGFVFIAVGLPGLVVTVVKRWIGRLRPSAQGPFVYEPFAWRPEFASLPSGHAATAFAALVAIGLVAPRVRPILWIYALAIGISRVVVTAHYPSDVLAGAAVGAFGAICVRDWFAVRRLGFYIAADGAVHSMPGPGADRLRRVAGALFAS